MPLLSACSQVTDLQRLGRNPIDDFVAWSEMTIEKLSQWELYDKSGKRKYLNNEERARFLRAANRLDPRGQALCYTLVLTGCRVSEALSLQFHHLDVLRQAVTIKTLKRRKTTFRSVPVPDMLVSMWVSLPPAAHDGLWHLHRSNAWRLIKQVMAAAEISGPMATCKGLRHAFGMHAALRNIPIHIIQRWMGHASPMTTAIYIDAVGIEEREFANRMW